MKEEDARRRVQDLEKKLAKAKEELKKITEKTVSPNNESPTTTTTTTTTRSETKIIGHPGKRGYLYKWRDRAIGWGGTKWGLRFIVLEQGRLAYYRTHKDIAPRYVLSLKGCAVRDEGSETKKNLMNIAIMNSNLDSNDFHVFSIYQRPKNNRNYLDESRSSAEGQESGEILDDESEITPLLLFAAESKAEKMLWIDFISEACACCETEAFSSIQKDKPIFLDQFPAAPPLTVQPGRLPPLLFGNPGVIEISDDKKRGKLFRSKSKTGTSQYKKSAYPPSRPMHKSSNPSYLSVEAPSQNFRGLLNLALIMLFISNFNILLHTIKSHGFMLTQITDTSIEAFLEAPLEDFPFITGMGLLPIFVLMAYFIELELSKRHISESIGMPLHYTNAILSLIVPLVIVWYFIPNPFTGATLCLTATTTWMKLWSYAHANSDYRTSKQDNFQATLALIIDLEDEAYQMSYPRNITIPNMVYFWFAPTLTYQMAYPVSPKIRWTKVIGIVFRLIVAMAMLLFLCVQIIMPNLDILTKEYKKNGKFDFNAEYLIKLALASTYTWLLFFYTYFHLGLNLIAELLKFGDRVFYKDWWNASEVSAYWRLWNMPVHYWLVRHVYFPCIRMRMSKNSATIAVFFVSAVIHEVLISVPFHIVSFWSFFGMMGQLPLITFTKYFDSKFQGSSIGNVIFWLSFCIVGQPTAILFYAIDFWEKSTEESVATPCTGPECEL